MIPSQLIGAFLALCSALVYGGADFTGGVATRRSHQYQVLVISSVISIIAMAGLALIWQEKWPTTQTLLWTSLAGICGALGLAALYRGLSYGNAAIVSPVSGVVAAALPVLFAALTTGLPNLFQLAGFGLAVPGIWMVSFSKAVLREKTRLDFLLGLYAGLGFGSFFIFLARAGREAVFGPLAIEKSASFLLGLALLLFSRMRLPSLKGNPVALLAGALDSLANGLYLLANRYTRLDIAAVLTSLYPAGTVFLSRWIMKESISRTQWKELSCAWQPSC